MDWIGHLFFESNRSGLEMDQHLAGTQRSPDTMCKCLPSDCPASASSNKRLISSPQDTLLASLGGSHLTLKQGPGCCTAQAQDSWGPRTAMKHSCPFHSWSLKWIHVLRVKHPLSHLCGLEAQVHVQCGHSHRRYTRGWYFGKSPLHLGFPQHHWLWPCLAPESYLPWIPKGPREEEWPWQPASPFVWFSTLHCQYLLFPAS